MKRDMDMIRNLLLEMEDDKKVFETLSVGAATALGVEPENALPEEDAEKLETHLELLDDAGFVEFSRAGGGIWYVDKITWEGRDFLDSVRDPEVWRKTKTGAMAAGGFTVDLLKDLAKGLIKNQIEERTGVKL